MKIMGFSCIVSLKPINFSWENPLFLWPFSIAMLNLHTHKGLGKTRPVSWGRELTDPIFGEILGVRKHRGKFDLYPLVMSK